MKRTLTIVTTVASMSLLAACGGGGGGSSLPDECKKNSPLQITSPGLDALNGEFTPSDTTIFQAKIVPGAELFEATPEELEEIESQSIGTAFSVIVADFPIKENQIIGGFNSGVFNPEEGGTNMVLTLFPVEAGSWKVGDYLSWDARSPYLEGVGRSMGVNVLLYLDTTLDEDYFLGGATEDYSGGVTVLAVDEKNLCVAIDYTTPVLSNSDGVFNVKGVISGKIEDYISGDVAV